MKKSLFNEKLFRLVTVEEELKTLCLESFIEKRTVPDVSSGVEKLVIEINLRFHRSYHRHRMQATMTYNEAYVVLTVQSSQKSKKSSLAVALLTCPQNYSKYIVSNDLLYTAFNLPVRNIAFLSGLCIHTTPNLEMSSACCM